MNIIIEEKFWKENSAENIWSELTDWMLLEN
jgi:hypothetical protein